MKWFMKIMNKNLLAKKRPNFDIVKTCQIYFVNFDWLVNLEFLTNVDQMYTPVKELIWIQLGPLISI